MDKTQAYMQNLKMEEVPWGRLDTAYGRAGDFPEYFKTIWAMTDLSSVKSASSEILSNIEHQSTLWHSTPFAMIFLVRIFEHAIPQTTENECADFIVDALLEFFEVIADCINDYDGMDHDDPLPDFSDLLQEDYLGAELCDEDDEEEEDSFERFEESDYDVFYSFWYYSHQALLLCKPLLSKLENTPFQEKAEELNEMIPQA